MAIALQRRLPRRAAGHDGTDPLSNLPRRSALRSRRRRRRRAGGARSRGRATPSRGSHHRRSTMNDRIEIKPDGLRRSANEFDDLADKTKKLLETLKSSSGSKGEAWGDDKNGHKFADGEKGYIKNRDNTFE